MKFKLLKPFDNICLSEKFCCPNAKGQERQAERKTSQLLKCGVKQETSRGYTSQNSNVQSLKVLV